MPVGTDHIANVVQNYPQWSRGQAMTFRAIADSVLKNTRHLQTAIRAGISYAEKVKENSEDRFGNQGKWITTETGRKVFIREGETLKDAIARRNP
jgi:flavorubredoxin